MPERRLAVNGETWSVASTGRLTQYAKDEFGLRFTRVAPEPRVERIVRYSPLAAKNRESSLAEMSDAELAGLLRFSQPGWTAPEQRYSR